MASSDVSVLGCGALGTVASEILVRSGVGRVRLIDRDTVEWSNLQRQSLYDESDAREGRAKADAAARKLSRINHSVELIAEVIDVTADNVARVLEGTDLVIDASDNFTLRFLINDWSLKTKSAWVHGGCVGASGQMRLFTGTGRPCFRCFVSRPPSPGDIETCDTAGVVAAATHLIASLQAGEAIKWLSGNRQAVDPEMLSIDLWKNRVRKISFDPLVSQRCAACGDHRFDFLEGDHRVTAENAHPICGRDAVQLTTSIGGTTIDLEQMCARWHELGRVQSTKYFARLFPDDRHSLTMFRDGRVIVSGTDLVHEARSLYDRYIGS